MALHDHLRQILESKRKTIEAHQSFKQPSTGKVFDRYWDVLLSFDSAYGADIDGNRGEPRWNVDDVREVTDYSDWPTPDEVETWPEEDRKAFDTLPDEDAVVRREVEDRL